MVFEHTFACAFARACTRALHERIYMDTPNSEIILRPFKDIDFDAVVNLCVRKWCSDIVGAFDRIVFGRVLSAGALQRSTHTVVAEYHGNIVGVCMGGICRDKKILHDSDWRRRFDDIMYRARARAKIGGVKVEERLFSRIRVFTTADVFITYGYANADAEINLIIVDPEFSNQGIGTRLFDEMTEYFRSCGARGCFVIISAEADKEFFEHKGMRCVKEKTGVSGDTGQNSMFLYARRL